MNLGITAIHKFLQNLTGLAIKKPLAFLSGILLVTALAVFYIVQNFSIHTDTDEMIDSNLPFRQTYEAFNQTFPQFADSFIIVIDAETPEAAEAAQSALAGRLAETSGLYSNVYAPGAGEFFDTNGFLYLDTDTLITLSDQLAAAEPLLAAVSEDQSLRGLMEILTLAIDDVIEGDEPPEELNQILGALTASTLAAAAGEEKPMSWQGIFLEEDDLEKSRRRLIIVQPVVDFTQLQSAKAALSGARQAAQEVEAQTSGITIRFTGKIALNSDELKSVADSMVLSGVLSFILVALVLGFGIRSGRLVFAALTTLAIGLIWTGTFALLAIGYLNIISVAFAVLFIGLGIDFAIHFVLRYQEEAQGGAKADAALTKTAINVGAPLALCAPTTALAFYAFIPTDYAGLAQLGLIAGTGMFISFFTSLTILPAILKLLPLPVGKVDFNPHAKEEAGFIEKNGKSITIAGFVLGALAVLSIPLVRFDFDPINLKDPETESVQSFFDLMDGAKTSPYTIQILASGEQQADALAASLSLLPEVDDVVTLESFIPLGQEVKLEVIDTTSIFMMPVFLSRGGATPPSPMENSVAILQFQEATTRLQSEKPGLEISGAALGFSHALEAFAAEGENTAGSQALLQQNLLAFFPSLLDKLDAALGAGLITVADLPEVITSRYQTPDGIMRVEVFPSENLGDAAALKDFVTAVSDQAPGATGSPVQIYNAGLIVKQSMLQASSTAVFVIVLFLFIILRRASSVALITIPVFLAGFMTMAVMVLFGLYFNFANVIVIPLLIGLGVDSGIHLVLRAREEKDSAKILTTSTPKAVLLSALTTMGSFGTLAISSHQGTASMGLLLTVAVIMILVATLLVLPGLMIWLGNARNKGIS